jgi:predicted O-methyltransferase YrrM
MMGRGLRGLLGLLLLLAFVLVAVALAAGGALPAGPRPGKIGGARRPAAAEAAPDRWSATSSDRLALSLRTALDQGGAVRPRFTRFAPRLADNRTKWTNPDLMVGSHLARLFAAGTVVTEAGEGRRLQSALDPIEGRHLYDLVRLNGFTRTLEVGMANGVSTLYIAQGVRDNLAGAPGPKGKGRPGHVAVDPFQRTQWGGAALVNLEKAGLRDLVEWVPKKSYEALPELLARGERFQLVFIDGMHLYDYTLVDLFYADLLLEPGGVVVIDDLALRAVAELMRYVTTNYPHLELITGTLCDSRMATLWKRGEDTRPWDFHASLYKT